MRKAILLGVVGVFMASSAATAAGNCGFGTKSASKGQTVVQDQGQTQTPAPTTKETKS